MLQLFDEGRLTDGHGQSVACKNAIFIMTSNLAATHIADHIMLQRQQQKSADGQAAVHALSKPFKHETLEPLLRKHFKRDEFIGRISEIVHFVPFCASQIAELVGKQLCMWKQQALARHGMQLKWADGVVGELAADYNVRYGARSLRDEVRRKVVNVLAAAHEKQLIGKGSKILLRAAAKQQQQQNASCIRFWVDKHGAGYVDITEWVN